MFSINVRKQGPIIEFVVVLKNYDGTSEEIALVHKRSLAHRIVKALNSKSVVEIA